MGFSWAYVNCDEIAGSGSEGPPYSIQFVTESGGATTGSLYYRFFTASTYSYDPNTLVLSGNFIITGAISASTYHIEDIAIIDATGSTFFGDDQTDLHVRTGSMEMYKNSDSLVYKFDVVNAKATMLSDVSSSLKGQFKSAVITEGYLHVSGSSILGDASGDAVTVNAATVKLNNVAPGFHKNRWCFNFLKQKKKN